jgi:tetratricopeptide (TPR) repeat protein
VGAALIAAGTFAYVVSPSRDRQAQPPPIVSAEPSAPASPASPDSLLADFDAAITDGDLDHASLLADKLGALAEKDPRVLVRQAQVAVIKADRAWLASRLVVGDAGAATANPALAELVAKSSALTEAALAAAPADTQAILARIDALRLAGNLDATEPLVSQVVATRAEPDVAYTIGARDFVAAKPQLLPAPPAGVTDLQVAAAASPRLARPQALLAYVLAERGELDAAREMSKGLDTPAHPNPLLDPLRAYIASRPALPTPLTTSRPAYVTAPTASTAPTSPAPSTTAVASAHPTEVEAPEEPAAPVVPQTAAGLTALGDAARAKGDRGAAQTYYTRALAVNPGFYAAMLGLADIEWETGARAKAVERYTQIKERFPNAPARVQERLSQ